MDWLEVSIQVDREAVESVSEVLARFGYGGVVIEEAGRPGLIFPTHAPTPHGGSS